MKLKFYSFLAKTFFALIVAWALAWFAPAFAAPDSAQLADYIHEVWQSERGLSHDVARDIVQTRDGYLWLATNHGAVRFDGAQFTNFNRENTANFGGDRVRKLLEDRAGNLWIATQNGLTRRRDNAFETFTVESGLPHQNILTLHEDRAGNLWVGTSDGLARFENGRFEVVARISDEPRINQFYAIGEDAEGSILAVTPIGVFRLREQKFEPQPFLNESRLSIVFKDSRARLWFGGAQGLFRFADNQWTLFTAQNGLPSNGIRAVGEDRAGNLLVGTYGGGLVRLGADESLNKNPKFEVFNQAQGLTDDIVNDIFEDRDGGLWVGTESGLDHFRPNPFGGLSVRDGLVNSFVWAVYEDSRKNVWIGTNGGGLARFANGAITNLNETNGLPGESVMSMTELSDQSVLVGTDRGGLARIEPDGKIKPFALPGADVRNWRTSSLYEDAQTKTLWIGVNNRGLFRWRDNQLKAFTAADGLGKDGVRAVKPAADNGLWLAAGSLQHLSANGKFTTWGKAEGIEGDVMAILPDENERVWFGSYRGGLYLLENNRITGFSNEQTNVAKMVLGIVEDDDNRLWISYEGGLQSIDKQELIDYASGRLERFAVRTFDRRDGLLNDEFNNAGNNSAWKLGDGRLIFANIKGAVIVDPRKLEPARKPAGVFVEQMLYDNKSVAPNQAMQSLVGGGRAEFRYGALEFVTPTKIRFRFKLEGFDADWIEAGTRRAAFYTNLPPGKYRFRVIAADGDGVWHENGAAFDFELQPRFYQTRWFYLLCAGAAIAAALAIHKLRVRRIKLHEQQLEQQICERTGELETEISIRQTTEKQLRDARDGLETEVARRTNELARANSNLREQSELLRVTLTSVSDAVVATDARGAITFINLAAQTLINKASDRVVGQSFETIFDCADENEKEDLNRFVCDITKPGAAQQFEREITLVARGGSRIPISSKGAPICDQANNVLGAVLTFWDLRPQQAAEIERRQLEAQLFRAQKMESVGTLAGGVAHDFNNLLTVMLGNLEMMRRQIKSDDPLVKRLDGIDHAALRAAEVTRQLLAFSRRQPLERSLIDLNRIVGDLLKLLDRTLGERIEIEFSADRDLPKVFADASQIEQVLMNLVVNARDAMPRGGRIEIVARRRRFDADYCRFFPWARVGDFVRIEVNDTGAGMTAETQKRLFEPFYTTKEPGKGTGLGLAVVYGIVEQHHGFVHVTSELGRGTAFSVYLPVAECAAAAELCAHEKRVDVRGGAETVLLAEDEPQLRELASDVLESFGYKVLVARDGAEAVEIYRRQQSDINLLLFDAIMPRVDGREAYEQIHLLDSRLPVLFVTGYSADIFQPEFFDQPDRSLLLKPYSTEILLAKVREMLDANRAAVIS